MSDTVSDSHLSSILDALDRAADREQVSIRQILQELGETSFAPLLLVPALLLVSPLSGIPGVPTLGAIVMSLIVVQSIAGRSHIWLPDVLLRRQMAGKRLGKSVDWLRKPALWIDRHTHRRMAWLTRWPLKLIPLLVALAVCAVLPLLEILPFVTSTGAVAISLFAVGILARDGLFVVFGLLFTGTLAGAALYLV